MSSLIGYIRKASSHKDIPEAESGWVKYQTKWMQICAQGKEQALRNFPHPSLANSSVFVLGDPILQVQDDYRYPNPEDWNTLLADESRLRSMEGHWLLLIASPEGVTAYNDDLGKLTLYIHEDQDFIFFCNNISLLRHHRHPELDFYRFGAYWHSMFPFSQRKYAPTSASYYADVAKLGTGGKVTITQNGYHLQASAWKPKDQARDAETLFTNMTLLPFRSGKRIALGLSGGMDIRPILAIILGAGYKPQTYHFGNENTVDCHLAKRIAARFGLPFRYISYQEAGTDWAQVQDYVGTRGLTFNPVSFDFQGYYPKLDNDPEVFFSGYFGELFRFRFMIAHLKSALETSALDYRSIGRYLFNNPPLLFVPEVTRTMHKGFWDALRAAVQQMPDSREMLNPLWMNLFFVRYSPHCRNMPNLTWMDNHVTDFMPYMMSSIISEHWRLGFLKQLNEGLHRRVIKAHCPELAKFPLAVADTSAAYSYRQYALKLKIWAQHLQKDTPNRIDIFLHTFKAQIHELRSQSRITQDAALDLPRIDQYLKAYYEGDVAYRDAILSFVSYALGK